MRTTYVAVTVALLLGLTLAGCIGGDGGTDPTGDAVDADTFDLEAGKGAIAGLLVDDRFRPIDLEDTPGTEAQFTGFVLLQETGEQAQTSENGEFTFVDLEPGTYTLRVSADRHEAIPQKVRVEEGVFSEASIVARRVLSEGGTVITEEYSAFSPCFINFVALSYTADCTGDQSGETARLGFSRNVSDLPDVTWVVGEALFNQDPPEGGAFDVVIRRDLGYDYSAAVLFEGRYAKLHLRNGGLTPDPEVPGTGFEPWYAHNGTFDMLMFGRGYFSEDIRQAYAPVHEALQQAPVCIPTGLGICAQDIPMRRGAGGSLGTQATFLISIFLGEPEVDPLAYCVMC